MLRHLGHEVTKRQYAVAAWLQHGPRRLMVQGFRGLGKSWITSAFVLWLLYRNPNERILVVSANEYKAVEFATFTRRLIDEIEQLRFLRPREGQRDSVLAFDVGPSAAHQAPSLRAAGITGGITGGRASTIVADDIENPKNSLTEVMREKLAEAIKEFDAILMPGGRVVYLGTPQTEQSVYRELEGRGYVIRIWPALYPTKEQQLHYGPRLAPDIAEDLKATPALEGHSTDPKRFSDLDLMERAASYGRAGFALQFMLDTSLSDAERFPLKTADFIVDDIDLELAPSKYIWTSDPNNEVKDIENVGFNGDRLYRPMYRSDTMLPYQGKIMIIDPSGRGKNETAYAILFHMQGMLFLKDAGGFLKGYEEETLRGLAEIAKAHGVNEILIESNFGDGMFLALFAPVVNKVHPVTLTEVRATGRKELRIVEDIEPVLSTHRIVLDKRLAQKDSRDGINSLLYQLTHITKDRGSLYQDDRVDCLAHGVRYFRDVLQQDAQAAEDAHLARERDKVIQEFREKWFSRSSQPRQTFAMSNRGTRR